jgi:folate-binding protein YgfZ
MNSKEGISAPLGAKPVNAKSTGLRALTAQPKCAAMDTGLFRLNRTLIRVSGPDAAGFLDNLLTQDVQKLAGAGVQYAALLTPQGKVIADMLLWAAAEGGVIIECDPTRGADLLRRLGMYKLRAQVTLEDVSETLSICYSQKPFTNAHPDPRFPDGALGWRAIIQSQEAKHLKDGADTYDAHRITLGAPDLARDAQIDEVFAGEALLDELNGVDFQKGCFVGQENVSRMKRRATTRKKFCPVVFDGPAPAPGTPVRAGAAELGSLRSAAGGRGLALIRLDRAFAANADGAVLEAGGQPLRLDPPPWLILPSADAP